METRTSSGSSSSSSFCSGSGSATAGATSSPSVGFSCWSEGESACIVDTNEEMIEVMIELIVYDDVDNKI